MATSGSSVGWLGAIACTIVTVLTYNLIIGVFGLAPAIVGLIVYVAAVLVLLYFTNSAEA
jgi:uncharacterized membrane protein YuzA (DUF378 family)